MNPKTNENFREWLSIVAIDELREGLLDLSEKDLSIRSSLDQYELRMQTEIPSQKIQEWRLRAINAMRTIHHQKGAIDLKVSLLKLEFKVEHARINSEVTRLKHEQVTSYDRTWIETAKTVLDPQTFRRINTIVDELTDSRHINA